MGKPAKLYASNILIAPNELPCQFKECEKKTYFGTMGTFVILNYCPEHLFPQLRKGQQDRLFQFLGDAQYRMSLHYTRWVLGNEQRCWQELSEEERSALPLGEAIASLMAMQAEGAHLEEIPLVQLPEILASVNA